jgi:hypothetical protein
MRPVDAPEPTDQLTDVETSVSYISDMMMKVERSCSGGGGGLCHVTQVLCDAVHVHCVRVCFFYLFVLLPESERSISCNSTS